MRQPIQRCIDLTGQTFGRLRVLNRDWSRGKAQFAFWKCVCTCGKETIVRAGSLKSGNTRSCGCLQEAGKFFKKTHGLSGTTEYNSWWCMNSRCYREATLQFADYGGRGITVCERWLKFENFLADMGLKPTPNHTIDRVDNNGNYEPSNCKWSTRKEQAQNRRPRSKMA